MSAPDLIVDYFHRDLDAAEDETLAGQLQASPAEAERFARLAAEQYKAYGLPEPGSKAGSRRGVFKWLLLALLLGGVAVALTYKAQPKAVLSITEDDAAFNVVDRHPAYQTPERLDAPAPAERPQLTVSAETPRGPFDIRVSGPRANAEGVYDAQGRYVADIHALDGRHFRWDGRDSAGHLARPGTYQLRLQAGGEDLKQWVEIEVR